MSTFVRLTDYKSSDEKEQGFFKPKNRYEAKQEDFSKIPTSPIAYWVSDKVKKIFENQKISEYSFSDGKNVTGNNDEYLKQIWEINLNDIGQDNKWLFMMKGGDFRKWYGNLEYVMNWSEEARTHYKKNKVGRLIPEYLWYKKGITWSKISSKNASFRVLPEICTFDEVNISFNDLDKYNYILAFLNLSIAKSLLQITNQTLSFQTENILNLPIIFSESEDIKQRIETITQQNIDISKEEWDSRETSWDFTKNELIKHKSDSKIETAYTNYCNYWKEQHNTLHHNEEELNRLFIDIYELQDELTPEVELKDITILKNETKIVDRELVFQADEIMKQFISYGVGVMFGRYSLDSDGLLIANMGQEVPTSTTFVIDDDNVIPVLEDDYFKDDIASRFVQFVKTTFGENSLQENIRFIENALGTTIRKYFVKGFYEDHIKRYKKRPIYWMVSSPKKGFNVLIYMHRYQSDVFARVRNSYLTEYISKLESHKETLHLTTTSETASDKDKKDADKQIKNIETKLKELIEFDRESMMSFSQNGVDIDLDDGVKVNYCKFKEILYPITGLCK
ncbi:BREX-1 system adenine-specific DNA-methyltransferase PglX [Sulfurimonas xiamenensis]|uniref:BREX-1 system adenine-specific DNA-methyltransferase PglX n=1 Tax=Sulfurimonas xiamenensis TaxID=2590021 RepID=A0AAJ4A4I1_9BACT|nr:BREX-1 system adenine-specific DNA-methyltransferase PglX [Sulfurimonas xiamenensis]QFR43756.1 BREX-1 system adenine-specific DNA-methyltransferase PglX [Sulfurimonas xiamenensis]